MSLTFINIMNDPVAYVKHNKLQQRDNFNCLMENIRRIQWKGGDRIVDIGSGDGSCTSRILKKFLPDDYQELIGVDRSEEMVQYANEHHAGERVSFKILEIGKQMDKEFFERFDHAFSFYALQWIPDQKKAYSQIYDLLTDGGDCLLLILGKIPAYYDVYWHFSRSNKWSKWVKNVDTVQSPFHISPNPEKEASQAMLEVGFKDVYVKCAETTFTYESIDDYKRAIRAVNPFDIPEELFEEYLNEYVKLAQDMGYIDQELTMRYTYLHVYGRK